MQLLHKLSKLVGFFLILSEYFALWDIHRFSINKWREIYISTNFSTRQRCLEITDTDEEISRNLFTIHIMIITEIRKTQLIQTRKTVKTLYNTCHDNDRNKEKPKLLWVFLLIHVKVTYVIKEQ
jgi:hypothetical protein